MPKVTQSGDSGSKQYLEARSRTGELALRGFQWPLLPPMARFNTPIGI